MIAIALLVATAAPSPSSPPAPRLRTIASVRSTPFCSSLGLHFNAAVQPMMANDRTLDGVRAQLVDLDGVFSKPDYQIRYADERAKLIRYVGDLQKNLPFMQQQINLLRDGERLTMDAKQAAAIHQVAEKLQLAYDKQYQLSADLLGVAHAMMDYRPQGDADSFQNQMQTLSMPQQMRDIKSYLRFDGQRDVIGRAENAAADLAIGLAETSCVKTP